MRAVLYTYDMMPITVLSIDQHWWDYLEKYGSFMVAVPPKPYSLALSQADYSIREQIKSVRITAEILVRGRYRHMMLFTYDEESALLLESAFLPGQQHHVNEIRREEYSRGFWNAVVGGGL